MDNIDETMSEEVAFTTQNNEDETFKFDEVKADEIPDSDSQEDNQSDVEVEEPARVPYSRLKTVESKLEERESMIASLEERLAHLEETRIENIPNEELDVPKEWVELYGDSDVSKRAFKIQMQREERLQENAVQKALEQFRTEAVTQEKTLEKNEEIIEDELSTLQETMGKRFTPEVEEDILAIVDEFSPTGSDGKYLSMFPFDKAYEIYELRNMKATRKTNQARNVVADLTGNSSEGEAESSGDNFKRGWDNWREAL